MKLVLETLLSTAQNAVNYALKLDPITEKSLLELNHHCIALYIVNFSETIYMTIENQQIFFSFKPHAQVDLTITAAPRDLWHLSKKSHAPTQHVEMHGNMHIAQKLSKIINNFSPDWEEALSHVAGDVVGHAMAQQIRHTYAYIKELTHSILRNSADYVVDEVPLVAAKQNIDTFVEEVDKFRTRCDRLSVRVNLLTMNIS